MKKIGKKMIICTMTILLFSCKNSEVVDQLPPITETGANTFGCIINGKVLAPKDSSGSLGGVSPKKGIDITYLEDNYLAIDVGNYRDEDGDRIYMYINDFISAGTYFFGESNGESISTFEPSYPHAWIIEYQNIDERKKFLSEVDSGKIVITYFDSVENIVSGTFELVVFNEDLNETIEITNGRFDINLNTVNN